MPEITKIAFLCPVAEAVEPLVFQKALAIVSTASKHGYTVEFVGVTERTLIHSARNMLAYSFLDSGCEWALWMDADMDLPVNVIPYMVEKARQLDTKFLTGVYYQRKGKQHLPVIWRKLPEPVAGNPLEKLPGDLHHFVIPPETTPLEVDACGFGCVLMHRSILEKMKKPFFDIKNDLSEDFYFCIKAKEAGFKLWADPSFECGHWGERQRVTRKDMKLDQGKKIEVKI